MRIERQFILGILAMTLTLVAAGNVDAGNLVVNGDFENTSVTTGQKVQFSSASVTGWTGGSNLTYIASPGTASTVYLAVYPGLPSTSPVGGNFVEADGDPTYSSTISQSISGLTVGQKYDVTFWQAAGQQVNFTGPTTEEWKVGLGSEYHYSHQYQLPQGATGPWQFQYLEFTATATTEALSFLAVGTPNGAPPISFLDGVSLQAVPEPSSLALVAFGVIGLALARSRRQAKVADV